MIYLRKRYPFNVKYFYLFAAFLFISCNQHEQKRIPKVFIVQPLGNISPALAKTIFIKLHAINPNIVLREPLPLPLSAFYAPRNRYRADSLIRFLNTFKNNDSVIVGLIDRDISTTKGAYKDWGVMGLGYRPGNACVVSTWRLDRNNIEEQFFKVVIHELGHTEGLPHCKIKTCFMRNAEGGRPLDEETDFCKSCKAYLIKKGWKLK